MAANKEERARAGAEAEVLLAEEQLSFEAWRDSLETVPTIKALRGKAESIRANELEKSLNKLGDTLTNKQKKVRALFRACGAAAPGSPEAAVVVPGSWPQRRAGSS